MKTRSFALVLTPLLDLLFIIIFAQLLQAKQAVEVEVNLKADQIAAREKANETIKGQDDTIADQNSTIEELKQEIEMLKSQAQVEAETREVMQLGMENLGELFRDQFQVPDDVLENLLEGVDDAKEVEKILTEIEEASPAQAVRAARKLSELLKRADFWDVYVDADNRVYFSTADDKDLEEFIPTSPEQARTELDGAMKRLPDPARIVFIVFSVHSDSSYAVKKMTWEAIDGIEGSLVAKHQGRTSFIPADWGISDEKP